jgi:hypothetical protein
MVEPFLNHTHSVWFSLYNNDKSTRTSIGTSAL